MKANFTEYFHVDRAAVIADLRALVVKSWDVD